MKLFSRLAGSRDGHCIRCKSGMPLVTAECSVLRSSLNPGLPITSVQKHASLRYRWYPLQTTMLLVPAGRSGVLPAPAGGHEPGGARRGRPPWRGQRRRRALSGRFLLPARRPQAGRPRSSTEDTLFITCSSAPISVRASPLYATDWPFPSTMCRRTREPS